MKRSRSLLDVLLGQITGDVVALELEDLSKNAAFRLRFSFSLLQQSRFEDPERREVLDFLAPLPESIGRIKEMQDLADWCRRTIRDIEEDA